MNIICNRSALLEAIQLAATIAPQRTPKPILQCTKLQADHEQQKLIVIATDNEITIRYQVPQIEVKAGGSAVLPAERLAGILRESADETVVLEMLEATCQITGKDSKFHIYGHDPEDFPDVEALDMANVFEIPAGPLHRMVGRTTFAAARENTRYAMNGVFWELVGKHLNMVATDGRRLAKAEMTLKSGPAEDMNAIVPIKAMTILDRVLHDPDETIMVGFQGNQVYIKTVLAEISANLMQGRFPKYQDVIPSKTEKRITLPTSLLHSAVKRAALLTNENSKGIELLFDAGQLCLSSSAPEAGDAEIRIDVAYNEGEFKIGFNPQYLLEMLRVVEENEVTFELTESNKPGLIRAGKDFLYVVMPITV